MAKFDSMVITNAGQQANAQAIGEHKIEFTRAVTSSYNLSAKTTDQIKAVTSIDDVKQDLTLGNVSVDERNNVTIPVDVSNIALGSDYLLYTLALFAKLDSGTEVIYGLVITGQPDLIPAYNGKSVMGVSFNLKTHVSDVGNINIVIDPNGAVSQSELETILGSYVPSDELANYVTKEQLETEIDTSPSIIHKNHDTGMIDEEIKVSKNILNADSNPLSSITVAENKEDAMTAVNNATRPGIFFYKN